MRSGRKAVRSAVSVVLAMILAAAGTAGSTSAAAPAHTAAAAGPYWIWFAHTGKCLTVPGFTTTDGARLDQWECVSPVQTNQLWYFDWTTDGYARIVSAYNGKCVNVSGAATNDGAPIIQWPCGNNGNEQWKGTYQYSVDGTDFYALKVRHTNKCLNVSGASTDNGALLIQYTCTYTYLNDIQSWFTP